MATGQMLLRRRNLDNDTGGGIREGEDWFEPVLDIHIPPPTLSTFLLFAPPQLGIQKKTIIW